MLVDVDIYKTDMILIYKTISNDPNWVQYHVRYMIDGSFDYHTSYNFLSLINYCVRHEYITLEEAMIIRLGE